MNPIIVMARLLGVGAIPRPVQEYRSGDGQGVQYCLGNGDWSIALEHGNCLIHDCHRDINPGDLYLKIEMDYGYCTQCVTEMARKKYGPVTKRPAWVREYKKLVKQIKIGDQGC